jgi:ABC-2 type transport system permease protein
MVREAAALIRARWLTIASYRLQLVFSTAGLVVSIIPVYFISRALQPMMANAIKTEGQEYFAFLVVGLISMAFINTATGALHSTFSSDISSGALEAVLATPVSMPALLLGMLGQAFSWTALRAIMTMTGAALLGAQIVWSHALTATAVLMLTVLAYVGLGILCAAFVVAFRTTGPFPTAVVAASMFLGGVYYPTSVIPSWLSAISAAVPLTYGLRALRRTLINGASVWEISSDIGMLLGFVVVLLAISTAVFAWSLRYARHAGTLSQY